MTAANSKLAAAKSCNSDVANAEPGAKQNCSDVINISVFFDGTGNNDTVDNPLKRWSNPARMWRSAQSLANDTTNFAIYVSGVGTPYNGAPTTWKEIEDIPGGKIQDKFGGDAFGAGGTRRTQNGQKQVNDALRQALLENAKKFNAITKAYAENNSNAKLSEISETLKPFNLVTVINLSVFGFSRGAALALAFVNDFLGHCQVEKNNLVFNHHPLRIRFLGLFDTVASFGLPSLNIDSPFDEKNLVVPDVVERCVHLVAAHELRFSFPVDLIRKDGKYRPNWKEAAYPGVHSDVGGGYEPIVQGISNNYSRIPMRSMMREAVKSGVRMMDYDDIAGSNAPMFKKLYQVLPATEDRFKKYMAAVNPAGTMEQAITAHMKALYSGFGSMTRSHIQTPDLIEMKDSVGHALIGHIGIAEEADLYLNPGKVKAGTKIYTGIPSVDIGREVVQVAGKVFRQYVRPEPWRLQAWQTNCSKDVLDFVQLSVHDSKAAFICSIEPFSYFRPRGMAESSRNVLARGLDWLDDRAVDIRDGVFKVYHCAEGVVVETWEFHKLVARKTYKVGEKFFIDTVQAGQKYSVEVYQEGKQVLISSMEKGERMLITSIAIVKKEAGDLVDATQKKAGELADAAGNKAVEIGQQIKSGAGAVVDGAGKAVDVGVKLIEDGWKASRSGYGF
jgi:hypothetical protein